jgi:hypothetical protein
VTEEGGDGEDADSEAPSLFPYMYLCTCVNEEGGEGVCPFVLKPRMVVEVYYESMERQVLKPIYECRCNGRLQTKRFTRLTHTGSVVELEHLKIKTKLTNEKFASVKGECEI